jgi:hypothetical protein
MRLSIVTLTLIFSRDHINLYAFFISNFNPFDNDFDEKMREKVYSSSIGNILNMYFSIIKPIAFENKSIFNKLKYTVFVNLKITREDLTSIKSFKNLKVLKEELDEFWDKHTFTHKMSHYLKW